MIRVAGKKNKVKTKYRLCLFIPICSLILITIFVSVGSYWLKIAEKYQERQELQNEIVALKEKEEELKVDVERLRNICKESIFLFLLVVVFKFLW